MKNYEKSLSSIKKIDDYGMFQMTYYGDYAFDEFLKVGAKDQIELEAFCEKHVFKDIPAKIDDVGGGCTCFVARNADGEVIFGRNYDFPVYSPPLQFTTRPGNGYASVSTASLLYVGYNRDMLPSGLNTDSLATLAAPYISADGMNEKGVAAALLSVADAKPSFCENKVTLNQTTSIRLVLDKAASVDEAVELLRGYNIYFGLDIYCHFFIADASGKSVLVEYWDNDLKVTETPIASNFIAYNNVRLEQGTAIERYDKVKAALECNGSILSKQQTIDVLLEIGALFPGSREKGEGLQWSAIYNLSNLGGTIFAAGNTDNLIDFTL